MPIAIDDTVYVYQPDATDLQVRITNIGTEFINGEPVNPPPELVGKTMAWPVAKFNDLLASGDIYTA